MPSLPNLSLGLHRSRVDFCDASGMKKTFRCGIDSTTEYRFIAHSGLCGDTGYYTACSKVKWDNAKPDRHCQHRAGPILDQRVNIVRVSCQDGGNDASCTANGRSLSLP